MYMNNLKAYDTFWLCNYDPSTHKSSLFTEDYANLLSEEWRLKFSRPKCRCGCIQFCIFSVAKKCLLFDSEWFQTEYSFLKPSYPILHWYGSVVNGYRTFICNRHIMYHSSDHSAISASRFSNGPLVLRFSSALCKKFW